MSAYRHGQSGATLVELLVVLTVFGVIGTIVTSGIIAALRSSSQTNAKIEALNELEIAGQRVSRDLRSAEAVVVGADPTSQVTALLRDESGDPFTVSYVVSDGRLLRVGTGGQTLVTAVGNAPDDPVFTYLDRRGEPVPSCSTSGCEGLAQVGVRLVRDVEGLNPVVVESRTSIRNLRYGSL